MPKIFRLHEKFPNVSEVQAVGAIKKKIRRTDTEFLTLVKNQNPSIVFKNEEGTDADRMMTPLLKMKLDALAVLVQQEWPGDKLRVTEAWDENNEHNPTSTHYEGRAADITTFPLDSFKLGRLAGLAAECRLGWVFFENTAHVHVSVKRA
jgi:hypothetical protein